MNRDYEKIKRKRTENVQQFNEWYVKFIKRLMNLLKSENITQTEIAKNMGMNRDNLNIKLSGKHGHINLYEFYKIYQYVPFSSDEMLGGKNED